MRSLGSLGLLGSAAVRLLPRLLLPLFLSMGVFVGVGGVKIAVDGATTCVYAGCPCVDTSGSPAGSHRFCPL